jgi:hypothetical protein
VFYGISDLLPGSRGLFDLPEQIRWTAGMVAQWASEDDLRTALRKRLLAKLAAKSYDCIAAHSLGSLITYDACRRTPGALNKKILLTFGSQIGNPFVRDCFAGRIEALDARMWFHLYNSNDNVFTRNQTRTPISPSLPTSISPTTCSTMTRFTILTIPTPKLGCGRKSPASRQRDL